MFAAIVLLLAVPFLVDVCFEVRLVLAPYSLTHKVAF